MRDVGDPELVRPLRDKLAIYQVSRTSQGIVANSCPTLATPCHALYSQLIHQALHGATGHFNLFAIHLAPNLSRTVDPKVIFPDSLDINLELLILLSPFRQPVRISLTRLLFVIGRRGDRQLLANWLDSIFSPMLVDKRDQYFGRRSSSAWAKKADALRRISLARFSSRFSRSNSLSRSRSEVVIPDRFP